MDWRSLRATGPNPARPRRAYRPVGEPLEDRAVPAVLPTGFTESAVASGLTNPTAMEFSPEGRLFVAEQAGTLEVHQDGTRLQPDFFRDTPLSVNASGERGLLGLAFDPDYAANHFVYAYYTATSPTIHNRLSRFTANAAGDLALAGSERVLLDLEPLNAPNHNGGAIHFGPDDKLYIGVGENANGANAQSLDNLLGKILRLNADGTIPTDNPFYDRATGANRAIWALGLRNPFTFTFQPGTGRMFINDVGERTWEEINVGARGANYGWPATEGATSNPSFVTPLYAYDSSQGRAIAGGAFYNPATVQFPSSYEGDYFFADFLSGWIRRIDPETKTVESFATEAGNPVDLRVGDDGSLYYLARRTGRVFRVQYTASPGPGQGQGQGQGPSIVQQPESRTVPAGSLVTFSVLVSGSEPLSYRWQRDGVNIAGATGMSYTISASNADNGAQFRAMVSNAFESVSSAAASLSVTGGGPAIPPAPPEPSPGGPIVVPSPPPPVPDPPVVSVPDQPRPNQRRYLARLRRIARRQAFLLRQLEARRRLDLRGLSIPGTARAPRLG